MSRIIDHDINYKRVTKQFLSNEIQVRDQHLKTKTDLIDELHKVISGKERVIEENRIYIIDLEKIHENQSKQVTEHLGQINFLSARLNDLIMFMGVVARRPNDGA